ncbi:MAG: sulfatase-like hydrolase/transferase [Phenylobacterium sp.]|uniref:sulfatase-like hydrolase/transferase n=1 Tax=Phenylobacterium sp. TaxID=1871053 RepID=UPI001A49D197|nr:sulfatase-like hydrolase/transferase [Phenylobacterium sp.]MBL8773004.1 sulfatase-like hydrolase/transferase [Phenylobacterium sp.]
MRFKRALLAAAAVVAGAAHQAAAQAPSNVPVDRPAVQAGPPRAVTWQQGPARPPSGKRPPNIILIVADDLGFNDLSFNGGGVAGGSVPTPYIDSIGRQGVSFEQAYSGHGTCAPSRAALLTGRYPTRYGFEFTPTPLRFARQVRAHHYGKLNPVYFPEREKDVIPMVEMGVPTDQIMLGELLQKEGYHTMQLGKWHLGEAPKFQPQKRGFSETLGFTGGASMFLPREDPRVVNSIQGFDPIDMQLWSTLQFYVRKDGGEAFQPQRHMTDYLTDEAVAAVAANRNRPFFMYLAYNAPHTPLQATHEDYRALSHIADHRERVYAAMIRQLDRNVGRVLQALQEQGLEENTLVIFTSDNGGAYYIGLEEINRPFRGWKQTFFEGGIRVPMLMKWPAAIRPGKTYHAPVSHFDIFATSVAAAGAAMPRDRPMDGVDLMPFVSARKTGRPHDVLFWRTGPYRVVRAGDWKLQVTERPAKDWLYDLSSDPTERVNLAQARPEKVAELKRLLADHDAQQAPPLWPELGQSPVMLDHSLIEPQRDDDEYVYWGN